MHKEKTKGVVVTKKRRRVHREGSGYAEATEAGTDDSDLLPGGNFLLLFCMHGMKGANKRSKDQTRSIFL
jgi:hypothetical protein